MLSRFLHRRYGMTEKSRDTYVFYWLNRLMPEIMKPLVRRNYNNTNNTTGENNTATVSPQPLIQVDKVCVIIISSFGILITFGALFPPLAIVIVISMIITTYCVQLMLGQVVTHSRQLELQHIHYLQQQKILKQQVIDGDVEVQAEVEVQLEPVVDADGTYLHYEQRLEEECEDVTKAFKNIIFLLLVFATLFYAFFLWDIIGDDVGWLDALWAPICLALLPFLLLIIVAVYNKLHGVLSGHDVRNRYSVEHVKYEVIESSENSVLIGESLKEKQTVEI